MSLDMHITEARESGNVTPIRPSPNGCNGNCNQGRACDCVPAVDTPDPVVAARSMRSHVSLRRVLALLLWPLAVIAAVAFCAFVWAVAFTMPESLIVLKGLV